jgi:hypothetical protein
MALNESVRETPFRAGNANRFSCVRGSKRTSLPEVASCLAQSTAVALRHQHCRSLQAPGTQAVKRLVCFR